jgi:tubulin alpha
LEHGLKQDGRVNPERVIPEGGDGGSYDTFFTETGAGKYVPRSIFVDLDPSVCNRLPASEQDGRAKVDGDK